MRAQFVARGTRSLLRDCEHRVDDDAVLGVVAKNVAGYDKFRLQFGSGS
jgi:hypothetical protein